MNAIHPGLYGMADAAFGDPANTVERLVQAGCRTVQIRAKGFNDDDLLDAALRSKRVLGDAKLIINDNIDVAKACGADGVHLGQEDASVEEARAALGADRIIGLSTHHIGQVRAPHGADYIGFGPVFSTTTKQHAGPAKGLALLTEAVTESPVPVVAIGGIGLSNINDVRSTGVHAWAVIRALMEASDWETAVRTMMAQP